MFKMTVTDEDNERTLLVEGTLTGPFVEQLRSTCRRMYLAPLGRQLVLDVRNLSVISQEGENLLLELIAENVKLRCQGMFTRLVLNRLARRARRELEETRNEMRTRRVG